MLEGWVSLPRAAERALLDSMVARGVWLEPTLAIEDIYAHPERYRAHAGEAQLGTSVAEWWSLGAGTAAQRRRQAVTARLREVVRHFHAAGGVVLAGTDLAPLPGFGLTDELALLVEAGLSPAAALRAATLDPARVFG